MNAPLNVLLIATIASQVQQENPFHQKNENRAYAHLGQLCENRGINLYITHFANAINESEILAWGYKDGKWTMVALPASEISTSYADLPQNFPESNVMRKMLLQHGVFFFNDLAMSDCLTDKVLTHQLLPDFIPPTFDASTSDIGNRLREASVHPDLRTDKVILKPRYGERGKGIRIVDFADLAEEVARNSDGYIVQPLLETDSGIPELGIEGRHDLRILIHNGEIKDFFVRVAAKDKYVCNQSHGAEFFYFEVAQLPARFREVALEIDQAFQQYTPRYYTIDVGVGRSGKMWVYELNTMPGISWRDDDSDKTICIEMQKSIAEAIESAVMQRV